MLQIYKYIMRFSAPLIKAVLEKRQRSGKECPERLHERLGEPKKPRPDGALLWIHAASVGESQSVLALIRTLLERYPALNVMITTGTLTSADMMEKNLPERAFHQFYPFDHPEWVENFIEHWRPDLILWTESELWPNMLETVKNHAIPAILINARLSPSSYGRWKLFKNPAQQVLSPFLSILCQTENDVSFFQKLGASTVMCVGNLKYNASPLPVSDSELKRFSSAVSDRPLWVYASTHQGEEPLAARVHNVLKTSFPDILTVIVPRHPQRRDDIRQDLQNSGLRLTFRGENKAQPEDETDIYIADTMGELGLFYRASPIACIGRSFSDDGGGGHNPIEAAQLRCAVLHGPNVQNLQAIFDDMNEDGAALRVDSEQALSNILYELLNDKEHCSMMQEKSYIFSKNQVQALDKTLSILKPHLDLLGCKKVES